YRQLLESLRELGILQRNLDRNNAYLVAKRSKTSKKQIKQFEIVMPGGFKIKETMVQKALAREEKPLPNIDPSEYSKIFVSNIPFNITDEELIECFNQFGEVESVKIPRNFH